MNPLVTVVTPSYNNSKTIFGAIDSVLMQSYPNIQYIVCDDASSDFDGEAIIEYIRAKNTGNIVDFIVSYLTKIYTSNVFKLDKYASDYKSYNEYNDDDIKVLQSLYGNNSTFIDFISTQNKTTRSNLLSISGIEGNKFAVLFNKMVQFKFIRLNSDNVYPTDKFRKVYNLIDKSFKTDVGNKVENSSGVQFVGKLN